MSIRKRANGKWQAQVYARHEMVKSKTFDTKTEAQQWFSTEVLKYRGSSYTSRKGTTPLRTIIELWLVERKDSVAETSLGSDRVATSLLPAKLLSLQIRRIEPADMQLVLRSLLKTRQPSSVKRYSNSYKSLFKWCVKRGYRVDDVMEFVDIPRIEYVLRIRPFDQVELRGLLVCLRQSGEIGEFYGDVLQVLASSGIRWGEARSLRVEDVLLEGIYPRFHIQHSQSDGYTQKSPKSGKGRYVPISPEILGIVEKYMQDRSKEDYLLSRDGTAQLNASNFRRDTKWKQISGGHTIHDFRHSAAVSWIQAGVPITTIKAWLGHANIQTTMRYLEYLGMDVDVSAYQRLSAGQLQDKTENKEGEKAKTENEE